MEDVVKLPLKTVEKALQDGMTPTDIKLTQFMVANDHLEKYDNDMGGRNSRYWRDMAAFAGLTQSIDDDRMMKVAFRAYHSVNSTPISRFRKTLQAKG